MVISYQADRFGASVFKTAHLCLLYSAAPLDDTATDTMPKYPTKSHYSDANQTNPWPILVVILSARLGSFKFVKSLVCRSQDLN